MIYGFTITMNICQVYAEILILDILVYVKLICSFSWNSCSKHHINANDRPLNIHDSDINIVIP